MNNFLYVDSKSPYYFVAELDEKFSEKKAKS